jgi:hypothetical protein
VVECVLEKYRAAVQEKRMILSDKLYVDFLAIGRGTVSTACNVGFTAW